MLLEKLRKYLLSKSGTAEETPFGPGTLVFKVMGKMFALTQDLDSPKSINLKCDPDYALALRAQHPAITGGYHMNKRHWNTITFNGTVPEALIFELIDDSYELVVAGLKKADKEKLLQISNSQPPE